MNKKVHVKNSDLPLLDIEDGERKIDGEKDYC